MAKGGAAPRPGGQAQPVAMQSKAMASDDDVKNEVRAFASKLGLAPGGTGDDTFDDFAPEKAKQRLGGKDGKKAGKDKDKKKGKQDEQAAAADDKGAAGKAGNKRRREEKGGQTAAKGAGGAAAKDGKGEQQQQQQRPLDPKITERQWNAGVGPRPGEEKGFKSLLGRDEATVWYEALAALGPLNTSQPLEGEPDLDLVETLRQEGEKLMEAEAAVFDRELARRNAADHKWLQQVKRSGTTADKVAAMTLMIRESVIANMKNLDTLLSWVQKRKGGKEVVRQAMEALQELVLTVLLPDRKLKFLEQQPVQHLPRNTKEGQKRLLYWLVEDAVKRRYGMLITALEECSRDNLEFIKDKATKTIYDLLCAKPEGEARLLAALTNKLGDPSRKVASKAGFLLSQLLLQHPAMKPVVVREVERFLFRPGLQERARYYAIVFLNQLVLSHKESEGGAELAKKLVELYFTLFRLVIEGHFGRAGEARKAQAERFKVEMRKWRKQQAKEEKRAAQSGKSKSPNAPAKKPPKPPKKAAAEEMDARMLGALITGVRRAFPYVATEEVELLVDRSGQQLFKIVHAAPFTVGVQALMLMYQLMSSRQSIPDRFFRALYAVLLTDGPSTSSKAPMFLAMLFKAMKADGSVKRVAAFAKRLLQSAHNAPPNYACAVLFMMSEVLKAHPALWSGIMQPEDVGTSRETFKDVAADSGDEDDGLETFKDVDASDEEEEGKQAGKSKGKESKAKRASSEEEDGEEEGEDEEEDIDMAGFDASGLSGANRGPGEASTSGRPPAGSAGANGRHANGKSGPKWPQEGYYDMHKREPLHSGADGACWWELVSLASHAHPSVSAMARTLMSGQPVLYDGDPLKDHNLTAFLDKFLQKKPKSHAKGSSLMQPLGRSTKDTVEQERSLGALSSAAFAALAESQVEPADLFFHRFYNLASTKTKRERREEERRQRKEEGEEADEDGLGGGSDDEAIDALIERDEQAVGLGDEIGDPDIGFDYDSLADAMLNGEEDVDGEEGEEDDQEAGEGEEGEAEEGESDDEEEEEDGEGEGDPLDAALDALTDSEGGGEGDEDEEEFELAPGAKEFLQAQRSVAAKGKAKAGKGSASKASPAADEVEDEEMEEVNLLDLPSPGDGSEDEQDAAEGASDEELEEEGQGDSDDEGMEEGSDGDDDDDLAALLAGEEGEDEDDEEEEVKAKGKSKGKAADAGRSAKKQKRSEPLFASADDYEHLFAEMGDEPATAKKGAKAGAGSEEAGMKTPQGRGGKGGRGGRGGRGSASAGKRGGRGGRGRGRGPPGSRSV